MHLVFEAMEQFVRVVELGSFSAAAESLGKKPSSITRKVNQLEHEVKTKLLIRSTRRLDLTPDGEQFYNQCKQILQSVHTAKHSFVKEDAKVDGSVGIATFDTLGRSVLVPLIAQFRDKHPDAKIAISLDNNLSDLYKGPFDLAIRYGRPDDSSLLFRPLRKMPNILVASPSYLQESAPIESPEDLRSHACLAFYRSRQHTWWYFNKGAEHRKIRIDPILSSEGGTPLLMWAKAHQGIALVSRYFIEKDLVSGDLVEVLPDWQASLSEQDNALLYLVWKSSSAQKPIVRAMINDIVAELGDAHI